LLLIWRRIVQKISFGKASCLCVITHSSSFCAILESTKLNCSISTTQSLPLFCVTAHCNSIARPYSSSDREKSSFFKTNHPNICLLSWWCPVFLANGLQYYFLFSNFYNFCYIPITACYLFGVLLSSDLFCFWGVWLIVLFVPFLYCFLSALFNAVNLSYL